MRPFARLAALLSMLLAVGAHARLRAPSAGVAARKIMACKPELSREDCRRLARKMGGSVIRELASINALVIELPDQGAGLAEAALKTSVALFETDRKVNWLTGMNAAPLFDSSEAVRDLLKLAARLKADAPLPPPAGEDPEQPWGVRRVNAAGAWTTPLGQGEGVAVAVIDTGITRAHPDLAGAVIGGFNALNAAAPDAWEDDQGHGSHVAGTIAAKRDQQGVVGVAPRVQLYAVKVLDADGNGSFSDVIAGIEWAAGRHIPVANMSLGTGESSEALKLAVAAAAQAGLTIVAAAGNSGGPVNYPAAYPETIAVAASDISDAVADFSSRGPEVDFIAPGVDVNSVKLESGYVELSGTSMAAPHVAGLAALAVARGARTPAAVRTALQTAARLLPGLGAELQGAGMIDAAQIR